MTSQCIVTDNCTVPQARRDHLPFALLLLTLLTLRSIYIEPVQQNSAPTFVHSCIKYDLFSIFFSQKYTPQYITIESDH